MIFFSSPYILHHVVVVHQFFTFLRYVVDNMTKKGFSITNDLEDFRQRSFDVLACTNAIARGVDVSHVGVVISVGVPREHEMFIHRVGRAGRGDRNGLSITLADPHDQAALRIIASTYDCSITPLPKGFLSPENWAGEACLAAPSEKEAAVSNFF
jgi:superfamily II DNA/RNA helicase